MKKIAIVTGIAMFATAAYAAVTLDFNPETGEGFVGKGEVQEAFGWNNRVLQQNAAQVEFRYAGETVTEVSWICTNSNNDNIQERARTTSTKTEGVVSAEARERNQVTGFILAGYDGVPTGGDSTEGNQLDSCPSGPWTLTTSAGDPEVVSSTGGLEVGFGGEWVSLE